MADIISTSGDDIDFSMLFSSDTLDAIAEGKKDEELAEGLDKVYAEKQAAKKQEKEQGFDWGSDEDFSDLPDEEGTDLLSDDEKKKDAADLTSEDSEEIDPISYFADLDDDIEIANGLTKRQLTDMIRSNEEFKQKEEFMNHQYSEFDKGTEYIKAILGQNLTETQRTIRAIEDAMNHPQTDTVRKGQLYNDLQVQKAKLNQIATDWQETEKARKQQEANLSEQRFQQTNLSMMRKYGKDWDSQAALTYAVNSGMEIPVIEKAISPALMDMVIKAMKYDEISKQRNDRIKETVVKSPRSSSSIKPHTQRDEDTSSIKKKMALKKAQDTGNVGDLFNFLED